MKRKLKLAMLLSILTMAQGFAAGQGRVDSLGGGSRLATHKDYSALARAMIVNNKYKQNRISDMSFWLWTATVNPEDPRGGVVFMSDLGFVDSGLIGRDIDAHVRCVTEI
jgi:hypothetical protein